MLFAVRTLWRMKLLFLFILGNVGRLGKVRISAKAQGCRDTENPTRRQSGVFGLERFFEAVTDYCDEIFKAAPLL
jgi:hypothetical protein